MEAILKRVRGDKVIWVVVILLSMISLLAVYSSTGMLAYKYQGGNTEYYLLKHFVILMLGLVIMYLAHRVKYTYYSRIFQLALFLVVPLLVLTLIAGLNINEAKRVLYVPVVNLTFQTSDLAKLTLIIYLARMLTIKQDNIKDFKTAFVPLMIPVLIICGLILPANFSTAALLFATSMVLMYIGRVNIKHIGVFLLSGLMLLMLLFLISKQFPEVLPRIDTWGERLESYFQPGEEEYQVEQSKIAIATGGIFGKFPGNSTQRTFLPHPYSDFIFAIIIEEYGLVGGMIIVMLYLILFYRIVKIATKCPKYFGSLLAFGIGFSLIFQAFINMAVAVNMLPVTGQTLPLISMGGTSIWFTNLALGIVLSVSKEQEQEQKECAPKTSTAYATA